MTLRITFLALLTCVVISGSAPALAQESASDLSTLQQRQSRIQAHRQRLEQRLDEQVRRIGRLKAQAAGVRRDFQLESALRDNQQLADKLDNLQTELRQTEERLLVAYDRAVGESPDPARRGQLIQERDALRRSLAGGPTRIVTEETAGALDGPEDLDEKADLLDDSREKVRRQLRQVRERVARLEHRVRLRRHGHAADDNPFDEVSTGRVSTTGRSATARPGSSAPATGGTDRAENGNSAPPAAGKNGAGEWTYNGDGQEPSAGLGSGKTGSPGGVAPPAANPGADSPAPGGPPAASSPGANQTITLQQALDPSLLRSLGGSGPGSDLAQRLDSLKQADRQLTGLLEQLSHRSRELRKRATHLRNHAEGE